MNNSELEKPMAKEECYTLAMLLNDILDSSEGNDNGIEADGKASRELKAQIAIVQLLIELAIEYGKPSYKDNEKLKNALEIKIRENKWLSGYMYYISRNPNFDYSWNYLRKQSEGYLVFLAKAIRFFNSVVEDINSIAYKMAFTKDIHVIFSDIIDVSSSKDLPHVKSKVIWGSFGPIAAFNSDYHISVKIKDVVLKIATRKNSTDAYQLIEESMELVNRQEGKSK